MEGSDTTPKGDPNTPGFGWTNGALDKVRYYESNRRWISLGDGWTRIGDGSQYDAVTTTSRVASQKEFGSRDQQAQTVRSLIAQLCETFYKMGWATGTGGGCSIRVKYKNEWRVFVAPSGIQKEDMIGNVRCKTNCFVFIPSDTHQPIYRIIDTQQDIFELDMNRNLIQAPVTPKLKQSACTPLWYVVYKHRPTATSVIHTHSKHAVQATLLTNDSVLKITHLEMLKGVGNHAYDDTLEVPIIENRPSEDLLADQLEQAVLQYPKSNAVLVRRHGLYVWGDSVEQAKTQAESFDYLFELAVSMKQLGLDPGAAPTNETYRTGTNNNKKRKLSSPATSNGFNGVNKASNERDVASNNIPMVPKDHKIVLLDIEGCTTSISFVHDVLFPYARKHLDEFCPKFPHLQSALQEDVRQHGGDPTNLSMKELCLFLMSHDIKSAPLKELQGKIWDNGYQTKQLVGHVYPDTKFMLEFCKSQNVQVYIYSSGSVHAQKLLFGTTEYGSLLDLLSGHFDITTSGNKKMASSYTNIAKSLNVEDASEILFVSDSEAELHAARQAGVSVLMSIRPGNVPVKQSWTSIHSLLQICGT